MSIATDLVGRRLLVLGGSAGIGRGIVLAAARAGASVAVVGRDESKLSEVVAAAGNVLPIRADLREPDLCRDVVEKAVKSLGGLDAVIVSSAKSSLAALAEEPVEQWLDLMTTNVIAPTLVTRAALEHLSEEGVLLYLSSTSSTVDGGSHHGLGAYAASKAALNRSIQAWRTERPDRRFVCMKIGDTGGTDVARDFDLERAQELFAKWLRAGLVSGAVMDPNDLGQTIVEVAALLLDHPAITFPELMITPVGTVMAPDQIEELMASVSMRDH